MSLEDFRAEVRAWCAAHVPPDWRERQTGVSEAEFVDFQKWWFAELNSAGFAVPHWPAEWGGGMSAADQAVLYQELAAHDAPRLVLAFVGIHHAAATLLAAGTAHAMAQPGTWIEKAAMVVPFSSPFTMLAKAAQDDALWIHGAAIAWQLVCVALLVRAGAALFKKRVMKSGPASADRKRWWQRKAPATA